MNFIILDPCLSRVYRHEKGRHPQVLYNGSRPKHPKKTGGVLPMTIIRQQSLFRIEELYEMEPTQIYEEIMAPIDLDIIFYEINKKSHLGAPSELNLQCHDCEYICTLH